MHFARPVLVALFLLTAISVAAPAMADTNTDRTGLAIQGYDPVAYFTQDKATPGNFQITAEYDGATYRFASESNKKTFLKSPEKYAPQFGGYCAYGVALGAKFSADPKVYKIVNNKLYLNLNPQIAQKFNQGVRKHLKDANKNWQTLGSDTNVDQTGLAIQGYDPVSYFTDNKAVPGNFQITAEHKGATYRFASEAHKKTFLKTPEKYVPRYGGYCAYGMALGAKFAADPEVFKIVDGNLYLNLNKDIAKKFDEELRQHLKTANKNWKTLALK